MSTFVAIECVRHMAGFPWVFFELLHSTFLYHIYGKCKIPYLQAAWFIHTISINNLYATLYAGADASTSLTHSRTASQRGAPESSRRCNGAIRVILQDGRIFTLRLGRLFTRSLFSPSVRAVTDYVSRVYIDTQTSRPLLLSR